MKVCYLSTVTSDPFNVTLTQTSATSVIVEWSQPSGGATVTGYVVHYSDGVTNITHNVPASSTCSNIMKSTEVQNPRRILHRVATTPMRVRVN